jgi:uncharacterized protein (TIGR02452 family)
MMARKIPQSPGTKAKKIAEETVEAIKALKYKTASGRTVSLDKLVSPAVRRSQLYKPDWNIYLGDRERNESPAISVTRESTLEAAARLADENPAVLNFASAKHPGGGFLRGALAQEESIARSSALYHTLIQHPEYYEENKRSQSNSIGLYLDYAIYSPDVPIIRNDRGEWLEEPYTVSFVTSPAPNRRAIFGNLVEEPDLDEEYVEAEIARAFFGRMRQVLSIMAGHGHRTIILGAWGCGVFGNQPAAVASMFKHLLKEHPFFDKVVFAIYDAPDSPVYREFEEVFR